MIINLADEREKRAHHARCDDEFDPLLLWALLAVNFLMWALVVSVGVALWNQT